MSVLVEPPPTESSAPKQRSFAYRFLISTIRFVVVALLAAGIGGGWYLAKKGFGRQWRERVVEELHKRGVEASVRRLTLDPFRGLVAQDVRIYDYKNQEKTLALISEVSLDINYAALFHHQPFLNAVDVRNGQLSLPLEDAKGKGETAQLKNFHAHVYFPPEQIYVSQAEGVFCGVRVSVSGQLIKRADYVPSTELTEEEWRRRLGMLQRVVSELQKFRFVSEPSLQVKFNGDLADMENARVEATLRADKVQRGTYEFRELTARAEFVHQTLSLNQCEWKDSAGMLSARGNWNRPNNEFHFQVRSDIDLKNFATAFGFEKPFADAVFQTPPLLEISGDGKFSGGRPQVRVIGQAKVASFSYQTVPFTNLSANFSWDGEKTLLRDVRVQNQGGQLHAELFDAPGDFRLDVESTVNPVGLQAFASPQDRKFLAEWQWARPPTVRLAIRGTDHKPETWRGEGTIALDRTKFRGIWMNSATANVRFGDGAVSYENLRVVRDEGVGTGNFTYDFKKREVRISNIKSSLKPTDIVFWIDPDLHKTITPYKFNKPPNLTANGVYQFGGGKNTKIEVNVDAPSGLEYVFLGKTLPFDHASAKLVFNHDRLQINDLKSGLFSGVVRGNADISLAKNDSRYRADILVKRVNFPRLTDLYWQYKTAQGELKGTYEFTGVGSDARKMKGQGSLEVTNGNVFAIPVFGPLSQVLDNILPGSGYSIARKAAGKFTIADGVLHTDDFEASGRLFGMVGHGDIHFLDDKLDFNIRISASGPGVLLTPMYKLFEYTGEGSLKNPNWHPKRF